MKKNKLYLHIGIPKTGSSALQQFFYENRERLAEKGIFYPLTGLDGWGQHHFPASIHGRNFKTDKSFEELLEELSTEEDYDPAYTILLSSEAFHNVREGDEILKLKKALSGYEVKIVVYLRRQDYWIQSAYKQSVKSHRQRMTDPLEKYAQSRHLNRLLNYPLFLKKWEDAFGFANIIVKVYEKEQLPDGIYQDFLNIFDLKLDQTYNVSQGIVNPSLHPLAVRLLKFLNRYSMSTVKHEKSVAIVYRLSNYFYKNRFFKNYSFLKPAEQRKIIEMFDENNQVIARCYLNRADGRLFYEKMP